MRKYLDKLGKIDIIPPAAPIDSDEDEKRRAAWEKEREEYGFDSRETWSLDRTAACFIYEHLMRFKEVCAIKLDYHRFKVPVIIGWKDEKEGLDKDQKDAEGTQKNGCEETGNEHNETYTLLEPIIEEQEMTQGECMDLMIEYLAEYLKTGIWSKNAGKAIAKMSDAFHIWAIVAPAMWW